MITDFDIRSLFPRFLLNDPNGYALAKAIEAGLNFFLRVAEEGLAIIQDVDRMPEWRLDELAWELDCLYDPLVDVDIKREWVRNAYLDSRRHGTAKGVQQYLKIYFGETSIQELGNTPSGAFLFDVNVSDVRSDDNERWIRAAVAKAKNVRSELRYIVYMGGESPVMVTAGAASCGMEIQDVSTML